MEFPGPVKSVQCGHSFGPGMLLVCLPLILLLVLISCESRKITVAANPDRPGRYGSEFPTMDATREIERITRSVKKIYSVSSYTTYKFKRASRITGYDLRKGTCKKEAWGVISTNETVFGTATVVGYSGSRVALLTCAHVVNSPDTLVAWFEPGDEDPTRYIQSLSIREKQENWVKDFASCGPFTVLVSDDAADIAILGKNCESLSDTVMPFPYRPGLAGELGWGSFVYIFGYPLGSQVITRGLASPAAKRPMGEFSVDALLNKGYSGGIILALSHGLKNFELVGMVKTVSSIRDEFLKPGPDRHAPDWLPYKGDSYIGQSENIQYGLNAVVPFEAILSFYRTNSEELKSQGYDLDSFFHL